ncbi:MAG: DUF2764 family protein [Planctomycetota bacterium]|jgi:hypothetical protein
MPGQNYYLLSMLPALGELGSDPPISREDLLTGVIESAGPREIVEAMLLGDDLLRREALLAGEIDQGRAEPVVLSPAQMRDEEPLPSYLVAAEQERPRAVAADAVWAAYFRYLAATARGTGSAFLAAWTGFEVALRNALAAERAKKLALDPQDYIVTPDLADRDADLTPVVGEWSGAADALAALRRLDRARWQWITQHDRWFTYADDELAAYTAKLSLLHRWRRLSKEPEEGTSRQ